MSFTNQSTLLFILVCLMANISPVYATDTTAIDLIHAQGCKGCHTLNGSGGIIGPSLDRVENRMPRKEIRQKLIKLKSNNPSSLMPDYSHMTEEEIELLLDYLDNSHERP